MPTEIRQARDRREGGSRIAETACGSIEYGATGSGDPVQLVPGARGGYDQGLPLA
ncbi:MAG: hypothetical protein QMC96_05830 [Methanomicrobiales archaeon]|nr:hypothetical protein [Methanomicrobiales archaeon]